MTRRPTLRDFAKLSSGDAGQGRFAKQVNTEAPAVPDYPRPPSGPWAAPDPSGPEPPLGIDVNAPVNIHYGTGDAAPVSPPPVETPPAAEANPPVSADFLSTKPKE
jgi:hypothetical protein